MLKLRLRDIPGTLNVEVYLIDKDYAPGQGVYYTLEPSKTGLGPTIDSVPIAHTFERSEMATVGIIEPLLVAEHSWVMDMIAAFASYGHKNNIVYDGRNDNTGKIEAQQEHIKDLRKLLDLSDDQRPVEKNPED